MKTSRQTNPPSTAALLLLALATALAVAAPSSAQLERPHATVTFAAAGIIAPTMEAFRAALGGANNGGAPGPHETGRREINWDAVPDELAAPNFLPADYFNDVAEPRARGALLSTPGQGVQVSADGDSGVPVRFGHINASYSALFTTFSDERLFSPVGSNVVDLTFFVPGTQEPALVKGFGAVYTDVNRRKTSFRYYDKEGRLLGKFKVPRGVDGLSFLGVVFDEPVVARVRIQYGTVSLGPDQTAKRDVAVMDDFIYGEPQAISGQ